MNSYNNIVDPNTGNTFSIFSTQGKSLLKQYVKLLQSGGAGAGTIVHPIPISDKPEYPMLQEDSRVSLLSRQPSLGKIMTEENERANAILRNVGSAAAASRLSGAANYHYEIPTTPRERVTNAKRKPVTSECKRIDTELTRAENEVKRITAQYNDTCASSEQVEKAAALSTFRDLDPTK